MQTKYEENKSNSGSSDMEIYAKNKKNNQEKVGFFRFLMYTTKAEYVIDEFHEMLFWVSIFEIVLFIICVALFISSPSDFSSFWAFLTHVVRASLGFVLLKRIPHSYEAIENLNNFENSTMEDTENQILENYKSIISANESRIKPILILYFVFTIIDLIIDNVVFFFLTATWSEEEFQLSNMAALIIIVAFFCKISAYTYSVQLSLFQLAH